MLDIIKKIAVEAGEKMLTIYDGKIGVTYKEDESPLTLADEASHQLISKRLGEAFPEIPVISEEGHLPTYEERVGLKRFFLVDPLDGTKEFIKRNGEFTVNIALIEDNVPTLGVVGIPVQNRLYAAQRGQGSWLYDGDKDGVRIHARTNFDADSLSASMSRSHPSGPLNDFLEKLPQVTAAPRGSSLKFCYVAQGEVDFYPRFGPLMEWDTAAAHVVAEEAGMVIMGLNREPLRYNKEDMRHPHGFIASSCEVLHDWLFSKLD